MPASRKQARVEIAGDAEALAARYAGWLTREIAAAPAPFRIALSGGATPQPLYRLLASGDYRDRIDWAKLAFYWGDERLVPHDHKDSNVRMARAALLDHVPLAARQIHPMPTDGAGADCAARYEALLKAHYGRERLQASDPLFDVVLLGVGQDGHTASLLPGQTVLEETRHWVASVPQGAPQPRLTLTYPAIASSRFVTFLVTGAQKAGAVAAARAGDPSLPAARVASEGELIWFLDRAAAGAR